MIFAGNNLLHAVLLSMVALFATTPALGSELALGCESSAFAEQRISTLKVLAGNKAKISVAHRIHPIDNQLCIVASTWLSANKSDSISIDVAIYQQSTQAKIAEFTTSISEQQVWFEPEIEIVSSQFPVSHNSKAFGVAVSWEFLAGTYSQATTQFMLLLPNGNAELHAVLSLPINESHSYRNCPEICDDEQQGKGCIRQCEGVDTVTERQLSLGPGKHQDYLDITVTSQDSIVDSDGRKVPKAQNSQSYIWDHGIYRTKK